MHPDDASITIRRKARETLAWLEEHGAELGHDPDHVAQIAALLKLELGHDLMQLEPRPALLALLDLPRRHARWKRRHARMPGDKGVAEERQRLAKALQPYVGDLPKRPVRVGDAMRVLAFFEPRPRPGKMGSLEVSYPSFWDQPFFPEDQASSDAGGLGASEATRAELAWASIRFAEHYIEALRRPEWSRLWEQQKALIEAGLPTAGLRERLGGDVSIRSLLGLIDEVSAASDEGGSSDGEIAGFDGMHETPFFVGRLAHLLGPPPESWGGGDLDLEVRSGGRAFAVHVSEGQGHGIRYIEGTSNESDPNGVEILLIEFVNALLESDAVDDATVYSFHKGAVYEVGVHAGALIQRRAKWVPFWIGQFWRHRA